MLKHVGKDSLLLKRSFLALPRHDVGAVDDGHLPDKTDAHHFLFQRFRLSILCEELGNLLIARGHVAAGGYANKLGSEHQFQTILVPLGQGRVPAIFYLLHLVEFGRHGSSFCHRRCLRHSARLGRQTHRSS